MKKVSSKDNDSFAAIDEILQKRAQEKKEFPYQEILLMRLSSHLMMKISEDHNHRLKSLRINKTAFMALITLHNKENYCLQPSELSAALGSSRTNATRVIDELQKNGWVERLENMNDRRSVYLQLTQTGKNYIEGLLPSQYSYLKKLWSVLSIEEQLQYERIMRKLLNHIDDSRQSSNSS